MNLRLMQIEDKHAHDSREQDFSICKFCEKKVSHDDFHARFGKSFCSDLCEKYNYEMDFLIKLHETLSKQMTFTARDMVQQRIEEIRND